MGYDVEQDQPVALVGFVAGCSMLHGKAVAQQAPRLTTACCVAKLWLSGLLGWPWRRVHVAWGTARNKEGSRVACMDSCEGDPYSKGFPAPTVNNQMSGADV